MRVIDDLTIDKAYELINSGRFYNGTEISRMSNADLLNIRKYAVDHYYDKWYWVHFYHMTNNEIISRGMEGTPQESAHKSYWDDPRVLDIDPLYH